MCIALGTSGARLRRRKLRNFSLAALDLDAHGRIVELAQLAYGLACGVTVQRTYRERKLLTQALRASEAQLRAIYDQVGVGIAVSDATGTWRMVNARQGTLLGYEPHELEGHHFREFLHADEVAAHDLMYRQLLDGQTCRFEVENRYLHRSGHATWLRVSVSSLQDDAGSFHGAVAIFQDVNTRKQAKAAVHRAEAETPYWLRSSKTLRSVWWSPTLTESENPIIYVNDAYQRITGYEMHETVGRSPHHLEGKATSPAVLRAIDEAVERRQAFNGTLLQYRKDGSTFWTDLKITPILKADGTVRNWVGLITDVTERVRMQEEIARMALHDPLTKLPNRALLLDRLPKRFRRPRCGMAMLP